MAYYQIKSGGRVAVYYWDGEEGKTKVLSRKLTRHLDGQLECNIKDWVARWEESNSRPKPKYDNLNHPVLSRHVDDYCTWRENRKKNPATVMQDRTCLLRYVLPYFVNVAGVEEPRLWPTVSAKFLTYATELNLGTRRIQQCNTAARGFWQFLQDTNVVVQQAQLRLIPPVSSSKSTPLKRTVDPDEVIKFVLNTTDVDVKLMALLGYFFSLRTQETLAVRPADLRAGARTEKLECCRVMARHGLFDKLAVHVARQKTRYEPEADPKAHSEGWVACFDRRAAHLLVQLLNKVEKPEEPLFPRTIDSHLKKWRLHGIKGITLKDLRRASIYWLGHHTDLGGNGIALKSHARHHSMDTTELYLRRPTDGMDEDEWVPLDLA